MWHVGGRKPPFFASFGEQFKSYDWLVSLDDFMSIL
jgi:hypothetical protein